MSPTGPRNISPETKRDTHVLLVPMKDDTRLHDPQDSNESVSVKSFLTEGELTDDNSIPNRESSADTERRSRDSASVTQDRVTTDYKQTTRRDSNRSLATSDTGESEPVSAQSRKARKNPRTRSDRGKGRAVKRSDGRYQVTVELGKTIDGKRNRKTFIKQTAREAQAAADRFNAQRLLGIVDLNDRTTVAQFAQQWLANTVAYSCRPSTQNSYHDLIHTYVLPLIGNMRLLDVRALTIEHVLQDVANNGRRVNTVRNVRRVMSSMFEAAHRNDMISSNPVAKTLAPRARDGEGSRKPIPLTEDEALKVFRALNGHHFETLFIWLATTGTRRGEALGLKWSDISQNEEGQWIAQIERQVREDRVRAADGSYLATRTFGQPKTRTSIRTIYLDEFLISVLDEHRKKLRSGSDGHGWSEDEFVFISEDGEPYWPSNVTKSWTFFLKKNQFRHTPLHGLRHTFATLCLKHGAPLEAVTEALGHSSIAITKDMYASRVDGLAHKATKAFSAVLQQQSKNRSGITTGRQG